jgi:hypothetical protein
VWTGGLPQHSLLETSIPTRALQATLVLPVEGMYVCCALAMLSPLHLTPAPALPLARFADRGTMESALTHCSWPEADPPCYQRLEFLGDAVLDLIVTYHLFLTHPCVPHIYPSCPHPPGGTRGIQTVHLVP